MVTFYIALLRPNLYVCTYLPNKGNLCYHCSPSADLTNDFNNYIREVCPQSGLSGIIYLPLNVTISFRRYTFSLCTYDSHLRMSMYTLAYIRHVYMAKLHSTSPPPYCGTKRPFRKHSSFISYCIQSNPLSLNVKPCPPDRQPTQPNGELCNVAGRQSTAVKAVCNNL